jgi:mono/diheme cytochrome c family protein
MIIRRAVQALLLGTCLQGAWGPASSAGAAQATAGMPLAAAASATAADPAQGIVARGKYLAAAGDCVSCHTRRDGEPFAGGVGFETPVGTIYSSNITPDRETGIGQWTTADLRKAMHEGIGRGGKRLFPAFPYTAFTKVSDQDVDALYAYLVSLKAVRYSPPANGFLFSQRWAVSIWNAIYFEPGRFVPDQGKPADWNTGAYLVQGLGHCGACHTPRNRLLAEDADRAFAGGSVTDEVAPGKARRWSAVNLTPARDGLAAWSVDELARYLKTGYSLRAGAFGPMVDVVANGTMQLTAEDVHAMATYLKALPPREGAWPPSAAGQPDLGASIYKERCEKCHMSSGRGGFLTAPPLAGSAIVQAEDPSSLVNIILYGQGSPHNLPANAWETMKAYADVLSDEQVAAAGSYVRASWKNRAAPVTASQVATQR